MKGGAKVTLAETAPHAGGHWTDDGRPHERRGLKHRARTETRTVGIPRVLVQLLGVRREKYGVAPDGRFFRGPHGGPLSASVYDRWWKMARSVAFTPARCGHRWPGGRTTFGTRRRRCG
jgi:hypothetical protein